MSQAQTYVVKAADAGKVLTATVTNTQNGVPVESESAQTAPVTQAPVFVDEAGTRSPRAPPRRTTHRLRHRG